MIQCGEPISFSYVDSCMPTSEGNKASINVKLLPCLCKSVLK